jgi:hypothetical protein
MEHSRQADGAVGQGVEGDGAARSSRRRGRYRSRDSGPSGFAKHPFGFQHGTLRAYTPAGARVHIKLAQITSHCSENELYRRVGIAGPLKTQGTLTISVDGRGKIATPGRRLHTFLTNRRNAGRAMSSGTSVFPYLGILCCLHRGLMRTIRTHSSSVMSAQAIIAGSDPACRRRHRGVPDALAPRQARDDQNPRASEATAHDG